MLLKKLLLLVAIVAFSAMSSVAADNPCTEGSASYSLNKCLSYLMEKGQRAERSQRAATRLEERLREYVHLEERLKVTRLLILRVIFPLLMGGLIYYFASRKNLPKKNVYFFSALFLSYIWIGLPLLILLSIGFNNFRCIVCENILKGGRYSTCEKCEHTVPEYKYKPCKLEMSTSLDGVIVSAGKNPSWFFTIDKIVGKSNEMINLFKQDAAVDIGKAYRDIMLTCASAYYITIAKRNIFSMLGVDENEEESIKKKAFGVLRIVIRNEESFVKDVVRNEGEFVQSNLEAWADKAGITAADVEIDLSKLSPESEYLSITNLNLDGTSLPTFFEKDEFASAVETILNNAEVEESPLKNIVSKDNKKKVCLMLLAAKFLWATGTKEDVRPNWVLGKWTIAERLMFMGVAQRFFIKALSVYPDLSKELPTSFKASMKSPDIKPFIAAK